MIARFPPEPESEKVKARILHGLTSFFVSIDR